MISQQSNIQNNNKPHTVNVLLHIHCVKSLKKKKSCRFPPKAKTHTANGQREHKKKIKPRKHKSIYNNLHMYAPKPTPCTKILKKLERRMRSGRLIDQQATEKGGKKFEDHRSLGATICCRAAENCTMVVDIYRNQ